MRVFKLFITIVCILVFSTSLVSASISQNNIEYAKNHLIVLVHGIGDDHKCFENVKNYLENNGLKGYVYLYEFSDQFLNIEKEGWEFGDRSYDNPEAVSKDSDIFYDSKSNPTGRQLWEITRRNEKGKSGSGKSWLEQAKEDFKIWYFNNHPEERNNFATKKQFEKVNNRENEIWDDLISSGYIDSAGQVLQKFKDLKSIDEFQLSIILTENEKQDIYDVLLFEIARKYSEVPNSFVPLKFIVIAHSMGGLAVRSYMYGKDHNGNRAYQDDIEKVVYIDTPHLGSTAGRASIWANDNRDSRYVIPFAMLELGWNPQFYGYNPVITNLFVANAAYALTSSGLFDISLALINRMKTPALEDMLPGSPFLNNINNSSLGSYDSINQQIIVGRGVATPTDQQGIEGYFFNMAVPARIFSSLMNAAVESELETWEEKMISVNLTCLSGYPFFEDGDLVVTRRSQKGEGVSNLANAKINEYLNRSRLMAEIEPIANGLFIASYFMPKPANIYLIITSLTFNTAAFLTDEGVRDYLYSHITMKDKIVLDGDPNLLEQVLFEAPITGSSAKSSINQSGVILSTNLTKEGSEIKTLSDYHVITIEAMNESNLPNSLPVVINDKEKYVQSITVKEAPTKITGVLRDFMPQKMQYFQYSENFSAWKDIKLLDEWGNFEIIGLKFGEGQNVIAFRGKNKVGYTSNQQLLITLNTIPMQASEFSPTPGIYTNNPQPTIIFKEGKASYSSARVESISLKIAKLICGSIEVDITDEMKTEIGGGAYDKYMKVEYTSPNRLDDGHYVIIAVFESNVGTNQVVTDFYVDTQVPIITMDKFKPYSPKSPTIVKYSIADNLSPVIKTASCNLYDSNNNLITTISTSDTLSLGDGFFKWDGTNEEGKTISDGSYKVKIKAFDLAGNYSTTEESLVIDSTPPIVTAVAVTPNPVSSKSSELQLTGNTSEKSAIFLRLTNTSTKKVTGYSTSSLDGKSFSYVWKFGDSFSPDLEDGVYNVEVSAQDDAGNVSSLVTLESVLIDRTPPTITTASAYPYVLANSGANAYKTTLSYKVMSNENQGIKVKIKLYNSNTGELVKTWEDAPNSTDEENQITWNANSTEYLKGAYRFQIIAEDSLGNQGIAYASCVKDGIAPVISYPAEDNTEVSGIIAIRGTAVDPDWTNGKPFKQYTVSITPSIGNVAIETPAVNRSASTPKNISLRPLQNNSTLAYLNTNMLANGEYTIKVTVDEENGESISTTRIIKVNNDSGASSKGQGSSPYIKLSQLPSSIDFKSDDSVKLPIKFTNSLKPANVYVEILKGQGSGVEGQEENVIYSKYFPSVAGSPLTGQPTYKEGTDLGYFIWQDERNVFHLRWSNDGRSRHFTGNIIAMGGSIKVDSVQGTVNSNGNMVSWDITGSNGGFNFTADKQVMINAKIDDAPNNPDVSADKVYLGMSKYTQSYLPIVIDTATSQLVNLTDVGGMGSQGQGSSKASCAGEIAWDGRLDTGSYANNGAYIIKTIAEGADGLGLSTDEAIVNITTPYEFNLQSISPSDKTFSTLGLPNNLSVFYNVSKDSIVTADIYNESGEHIANLAKGEQCSGAINRATTLSWHGNYPNADSTQVVTGGTYRLVIRSSAIDGSGSDEKAIDNISVKSFSTNFSLVNLLPIGNEVYLNNQKEQVAEGESPFYFSAKGIGKYYPPKDFNYTLTATGEQKITGYPYVAYTGLMHRGFKKINVKFKVYLHVNAYYESKDWLLNWGSQGSDFDLVLTGEKTFSGNDKIFETTLLAKASDHYPQNSLGLTRAGAVTGATIKGIEVWTSDGSYSLEVASDLNLSESSNYSIFGKGIFSAQNAGYANGADYNVVVKIKLPDESPIEYSRLTNRFVPFIGFVSAKQSVTKDFSEYMVDVQKGLGFPGKSFFNDPNAKFGSPYKSNDEMIAEFTGKSWDEINKLIKEKANDISVSGGSGNITTGYDSYLSDEYFEFIPITKPDGGDISCLKNYPAVTAYTNLVYPAEGSNGIISPLNLSWPFNEAEYNNFLNEQSKKLEKLIENPQQNYTGYGATNLSTNMTAWTFDDEEINNRKNPVTSSKIGTGQVRFEKNQKKSVWRCDKTNGELISLSNLGYTIINPIYSIQGNNRDIKVYLTSTFLNGNINAETVDNSGFDWTTADDGNLLISNNAITSGLSDFNQEYFLGRRTYKLSDFYKISDDYQSASALKYTFLKYNPFNNNFESPTDNPNIIISDWTIAVKDKSGNENRDIRLESLNNEQNPIDKTITLKLKIDSPEDRFVEIEGTAPSAYELSYFDGKTWKTISKSDEGKSGRLAWWNVSRLNGKYTVLLKSNGIIATRDISIGTIVPKGTAKTVYSAYKRAQLEFPAGAFKDENGIPIDKLATITPVSLKEIYIRNKPIILTTGPIVEIKPSPWRFSMDSRPTLKFIYTLEDLRELELWNDSMEIPEIGKDYGLPLNIHQITKSGDLQVVSGNKQDVELNNGEYQYVFYAPLDHFSTYTLLNGKFSLSAPIVFADRYITNKETVTIYGTAEPNSILNVYVYKEPVNTPLPLGEGKLPGSSQNTSKSGEGLVTAGEDGKFNFKNIPLSTEGDNYIYVTSHPAGDENVTTYSDVMVKKDTVAPSVECSKTLSTFSPNGDGKFDSIDFTLKSNENGTIYFKLEKVK
ncbi:hypothetical protein A3J90_02515 [candidate division WOR-1 bacterium RIFOXYC2_FULL_37_10]|nr:MAG: hypothetical protein A3J90_02515 [candidate division WOR-1 bacterium RIFOXYC2_FULL_37_10]